MLSWPSSFLHVNDAMSFIREFCGANGIGYTDFEGVEPERFLSYVLFNTARHAWQDRKFDMRYVPGGWKRAAPMLSPSPVKARAPQHQRAGPVSKKAPIARPVKRLSLPAAIERLNAVLPTWPSSFYDLNAARDYMRQFCYVLHFEYTGHTDIEDWKFGLYVHFNTAKDAYKAGKFVLDEEGEARRIAGVHCERPVSRGSDETLTEEKTEMFHVSTAAYDVPAGEKGEEKCATQDDAGTDSSRPELLMEFEDDSLKDDQEAVTAQIHAEEIEGMAREKDDPFKVCSSTVQRGGVRC
jgi:hypothetical protein